MPYTTPLLDVPSVPAAQGKISNPDDTPTREYVTLFRQLEACLERMKAALDQLEPP
jgi:hypothetical protein